MTTAKVKQGEEAADKLIAELAAQARGEQPTEVSPEASNETPPVEIVTPEVITPEETPAAVEPRVEVPATDELQKTVESLQEEARKANERWKVLQGMLNKKDEENDQLRMMLAQLSAPSEEEVKPSVPQVSVTDKDTEEYGAELIDLIGRKATVVASGLLASFVERLETLEQQVNGVATASKKTAENVFETELTRLVPNWREINVDPSFMEWLDVEEGFAGEKRLTLLQNAYKAGDANRSAKFFSAFAETTNPAPAVEQPVEEPVAPAPSAERHIAPSKTSASAPAKGNEKRTWTKADITKLYQDAQTGKITAAEFEALERDLFLAQPEGRIAQG